MIAITNMDKPEYCRVCHERLKCKQYDGEILHTPDDCPLIDIDECKDCIHRDPEDKKCDCGQMERQGCIFPVADDYFCKNGERRE